MTVPSPFATKEELEAVAGVALSAAREAGAIVLEGFRERVVVEHKGAIDLVTKYDRESETLLKKRLAALAIPIVGEEGGGEAHRGGPVLYVDPLDGTTNFVHGHPFWCVSIGLVVAGLPVAGVIVSPPLGLEWVGWIAASGERRAVRCARAAETTTESPCRMSQTGELEHAMLATGFPYDRRTSHENNLHEFSWMKLKVQAIRRCGAAAIDLCFVADGTYDGYWEQKLSPWDLAGGCALVRAAGGTVTDYDGGADLLGGRIVAANALLHETLLAEVASARLHRSR